MMVEFILESSQDFGNGMANGGLPQWKRELLQRRQARARAPSGGAPVPPPPPPPPPPEEEELHYGPGIVKRLKSRYLSLALRDAPRRRASVLRRAASLEHLLEERPPRAPRAPRPASLAPSAALPSAAPRRDSVKRARSVDALSRLEAHPELEPPRPPRAPRRVQPLLRDKERPPPDVVRAALRKFESAPPRRAAPAARLPAVLRGLDPDPERETVAPPPRSPSPIVILAESNPPSSPPPPPPTVPPPRPSSPFVVPAPESMDSPIVATLKLNDSVVPIIEKSERSQIPEVCIHPIARLRSEVPGSERSERDGAPAQSLERDAGARVTFSPAAAARGEAHLPPLSATNSVLVARRVGVIRPMPPAPAPAPAPATPDRPRPRPRVNGHSTPEPGALSRIGAAGIERAWSGSSVKRIDPPAPEERPPWLRAATAPRPRAPPPANTSIVFNFSNRKEVPDYIENDGIILRANRRNRIKAGETGVVVLRPEAVLAGEEEEGGEGGEGPPSPCDVRFVNDNVLINGKSSMPAHSMRDPDRIKKLKLQFDDSLTRTFEYPSETSLCEETLGEPPETDTPAPLADNTHIASAVLCRYTPSKTCAATFHLGLTNPHPHADNDGAGALIGGPPPEEEEVEGEEETVPPSWSDARAHHTDLLF